MLYFNFIWHVYYRIYQALNPLYFSKNFNSVLSYNRSNGYPNSFQFRTQISPIKTHNESPPAKKNKNKQTPPHNRTHHQSSSKFANHAKKSQHKGEAPVRERLSTWGLSRCLVASEKYACQNWACVCMYTVNLLYDSIYIAIASRSVDDHYTILIRGRSLLLSRGCIFSRFYIPMMTPHTTSLVVAVRC